MTILQQYLASLTEVEAERVLTRTMGPGTYYALSSGTPACLVGTVCDSDYDLVGRDHHRRGIFRQVAARDVMVERIYDRCCKTLGTAETNAKIRQRLLDLRVQRELAQVEQLTEAR